MRRSERSSCGCTGVSLSDRTGHGDKRGQIFYRNTNRLSLVFAGKRSWRICFNGSLSVKRIELLYSVVKEHERRKSSFLYTALENRRNVTNIQIFLLSYPNYLCNIITANNRMKYLLHFISGQKSVICITFLKFFSFYAI